jgi:hypothetical protein
MLGALLTHAPAQRIDDVRLAAPVRADNANDVVIEVDNRSVHEGLETGYFQLLDMHARVPGAFLTAANVGG